jgi:uncharacterized membrane protein YtjA (UPF0391 family)
MAVAQPTIRGTAARPNLSSLTLMLGYVITFFVVTVVTGILGFGVFAGHAATFARVLCACFAVLLVIAVFRGTVPTRSAKP